KLYIVIVKKERLSKMMNYRTSDVAQQLNMNPKIIAKIAKKLNIQKDESGYYLYTNEDIEQISVYQSSKKIKGNSPSINNIDIIQNDIIVQSETPVIQHPIQQETEFIKTQFTSLEERMKDLEYSLTQKADDVVSYQLIQHRQELEDIHKEMKKIGEDLSVIQEQMIQFHSIAATFQESLQEEKKSF